ncbi:MAG TPA: hypothetical protein VF625_04165 [Longimicrobium sp.]
MSPLFFVVARLWWRITRRAWRENTLLLASLVAFTLIHGYHTVRIPPAARPGALSLLFASALAVALFGTLRLPGAGVLGALRFDLLPIPPFQRFLLRPLFGNPFRLSLSLAALAWGLVAVALTTRGALASLLDAAQLVAWTAAGLVAAEIVEGELRGRPSPVLALAVNLASGAALVAFSAFDRVWRMARAGEARLPEPLAALAVGGGASLAWEAGAVLAALALVPVLLWVGSARGEHPRLPRGGRPWPFLTNAPSRVARLLAPRAPYALARELALSLRLTTLYPGYFLLLICAASAFSAGNPALIAAGFLFWLPTVFNLLGPDASMGGLARLALVPVSPRRVFAIRHTAQLIVALCVTAAALALVTVLRGPRPLEGGAAPYLVSLSYGATLFLLFTVAGDRISRRAPRAPGASVVTVGGGLVVVAASAITLAGAGGALGVAMVAASLLGADGDGRFWLGLAFASALHCAAYFASLRAHGRAR